MNVLGTTYELMQIIWHGISTVSLTVVSWFTTSVNDLLANIDFPGISDILSALADWLNIGSWSIAELMFGGGVVIVLGYILITWILNIIT